VSAALADLVVSLVILQQTRQREQFVESGFNSVAGAQNATRRPLTNWQKNISMSNPQKQKFSLITSFQQSEGELSRFFVFGRQIHAGQQIDGFADATRAGRWVDLHFDLLDARFDVFWAIGIQNLQLGQDLRDEIVNVWRLCDVRFANGHVQAEDVGHYTVTKQFLHIALK
jgi:hypothetical protein